LLAEANPTARLPKTSKVSRTANRLSMGINPFAFLDQV
jgi:hypothetical protein